METSPALNVFSCAQCGGELHPDEGQIFLTCPYCASTVYLDKSRVVFHWYLAPTLDASQGRASLARWMAGNETVKDLDKKAVLTGESFAYFPLWYFKRNHPEQGEKIVLAPAAATSVSELRHLQLPAGDLRKYNDDIALQAQDPSVPLEAALSWLEGEGVPRQQVAESALVHIPIFIFKYAYQGKTYTAVVEAGTGRVFANLFPAKAEAPYQAIGIATALVFLCLATFPVAGALTAGEAGIGVGFAVCAGLGLILAPLLFGLAAWVAAKV